MTDSKANPLPSRRRLLAYAAVGLGLSAAYIVWSPGAVVVDGRHDVGANGIWMQHGWLGADDWFERYGKESKKAIFRNERNLVDTARLFQRYHVRDVFPHLCPARMSGAIAAHDPAQTERFLSAFEGLRVMPWVGGVLGESARPDDAAWRGGLIRSIHDLIKNHPRIAGIHINIEPCPNGYEPLLVVLDELRRELPAGKVVSIAAYPPPTILHPFDDVHWGEAYFREVAKRVDQIAVMLYDTSLRNSKLYRSLVKKWVEEVLDWSGKTSVLLGLPAYDDLNVGYHDAEVENVDNALAGVHAALRTYSSLPANYQGVALYSDWEMTQNEWDLFRTGFVRNETSK